MEINTKLNLWIVDDHKIFRDGLTSIIKRLPYINEIKHAVDGQELLELLSHATTLPHLIFMDINMPKMNGIETTIRVKSKYNNIHILALTMYDDETNLNLMINAGCMGYLLKSTDYEELDIAIRHIMNGKKFLSKQLNDMFYQNAINTEQTSNTIFNERELEILKMICQELSTKEIAERLFISIKTAELYRARLLQKTNSKNTAGVVVFAMKHGFYKGT